MSDTESIYQGQGWLIARMSTIISENLSIDGVCFGVAAMAMQAIISDELKMFDARIKWIHTLPLSGFKEEIERVNDVRLEMIETIKKNNKPLRDLTDIEKEPLLMNEEVQMALKKLEEIVDSLITENKIPADKKTKELKRRRKLCLYNAFIQNKIEEKISELSEEDKSTLDIPVFFNGIQLYQQHHLYPELHNEGRLVKDPILSVLDYISPKVLDKNGVSLLKHFSGAYTEKELIQYFQSFITDGNDISASPLAFVMHNLDHAITIGYNPKTSLWSITNASALPTQYTNDVKELAELVLKGLSNNSVAIFSTSIYSKESDKPIWEKTLSLWEKQADFQDIHTITLDKVQKTDSRNQSLLAVAAGQGDLNLVNQILEIEKTIEPDQRLRSISCPALSMAAQNNHMEVFNVLIESGEDLNQSRQLDNANALIIATSLNNNSMVNLLLEKNADPNIANRKGLTSLHIAAINGNEHLAEALLEKNADCNTIGVEGATPLFWASQLNQEELVILLLQHNANTELPLYTNAAKLKKFAKQHGIENEMEVFINKKLASGNLVMLPIDTMIHYLSSNVSEPYITVEPREIAVLLGHENIVSILDEHLNKLENAPK